VAPDLGYMFVWWTDDMPIMHHSHTHAQPP